MHLGLHQASAPLLNGMLSKLVHTDTAAAIDLNRTEGIEGHADSVIRSEQYRARTGGHSLAESRGMLAGDSDVGAGIHTTGACRTARPMAWAES